MDPRRTLLKSRLLHTIFCLVLYRTLLHCPRSGGVIMFFCYCLCKLRISPGRPALSAKMAHDKDHSGGRRASPSIPIMLMHQAPLRPPPRKACVVCNSQWQEQSKHAQPLSTQSSHLFLSRFSVLKDYCPRALHKHCTSIVRALYHATILSLVGPDGLDPSAKLR